MLDCRYCRATFIFRRLFYVNIISSFPCWSVSYGEGICLCEEGWKGEKCTTENKCPIEKEVQCSGKGWWVSADITNNTTPMDAECGDCFCKNKWASTQTGYCNTCTLNCGAHGKADEDCSECRCTPGYMGQTCNCKYVEVSASFKYLLPTGTDWSFLSDASSTETARLGSTLTADLAIALNLEEVKCATISLGVKT